MKRKHDTALEARQELVKEGFFPLHSRDMSRMEWARPGQLNDVRVIRRRIIDADEQWFIEKKP